MRGAKPYLTVVDGSGAVQEMPSPPEWLGPSGIEEWQRVMPDLLGRGLLKESDLGSVAAYCLAMGQVRDLQSTLLEKGMVVYPENGGLPKRHPAAVMQAEAMNIALRLAAELGLTPVSRQRPGSRTGSNAGGGDDEHFGGLGF